MVMNIKQKTDPFVSERKIIEPKPIIINHSWHNTKCCNKMDCLLKYVLI